MTEATKKSTIGRKSGFVAAAILGALLLTPASDWLVKNQLSMASGGPLFGDVNTHEYGDSARDTVRARCALRIAAQNPDDLGLQIAAREAAVPTVPEMEGGSRETGTQYANALRPLLPRFADRPALHATLLRYLGQNAVTLSYRNDAIFVENLTPHAVYSKPDPNQNTPETLRYWETLAKQGEAIDGDNAYFPLMNAVGLFAARRDEEAIDALLRAGNKTVFVEYLGDETEAQWRLSALMYGRQGFLPQLSTSAGQRYPQYSLIAHAADDAVNYAAHQEMAGNRERGFAVRQALLRVGTLMRTDCGPLFGGLYGHRIAMRAALRPGGAIPLPKVPYDDVNRAAYESAREARQRKTVERYAAYLTRIKHERDADALRAAFAAGEKYRRFYETAQGLPQNGLNGQATGRLVKFWTMGVGLLLNVFVMSVLGGLCAWAAKSPRIQKGEPLLPSVRAGIVSALLLPLYGGFVVMTFPELPSCLLLLGGVAALCFWICRAAARTDKSSLRVSGAIGEAAWKSRNVADFCKAYGLASVILGGLAAIGGSSEQILHSGQRWMGFCFDVPRDAVMTAGVAVCMGVSPLIVGAFAARSLIKRVPVSVGVVRGLRRFALPIIAALTVAYAGMVLVTLREEAQATNTLRAAVTQGESRYYGGAVYQGKGNDE